MKVVTPIVKWLFMLSLLALGAPQDLTGYQQKTYYNPSPQNAINEVFELEGHPLEIPVHFHVNQPRLQGILPQPPFAKIFESGPASFRKRFSGYQKPLLIPANLFTPNAVRQPAETKGQIEEYNKFFVEEAKELEKEAEKDLSFPTEFYDGDLENTTPAKVYVNFKGREFNYNYSV